MFRAFWHRFIDTRSAIYRFSHFFLLLCRDLWKSNKFSFHLITYQTSHLTTVAQIGTEKERKKNPLAEHAACYGVKWMTRVLQRHDRCYFQSTSYTIHSERFVSARTRLQRVRAISLCSGNGSGFPVKILWMMRPRTGNSNCWKI